MASHWERKSYTSSWTLCSGSKDDTRGTRVTKKTHEGEKQCARDRIRLLCAKTTTIWDSIRANWQTCKRKWIQTKRRQWKIMRWLIINWRGQKKRIRNRLKIHRSGNRRGKVWVRTVEKAIDIKSEGENKWVDKRLVKKYISERNIMEWIARKVSSRTLVTMDS